MAKKYLSLERLKEYDALIKTEIDEKIDASKIIVDSELSSSSTNPVQNKVIDAEFDAIATAMDVLEQAIDDKINISDIIDNLETSEAGKVLSAKQGKALMTLIEALQGDVSTHTSNEDIHITSSDRAYWNAIESNVKEYTDNAVAQKTLVQIVRWGADE